MNITVMMRSGREVVLKDKSYSDYEKLKEKMKESKYNDVECTTFQMRSEEQIIAFKAEEIELIIYS